MPNRGFTLHLLQAKKNSSPLASFKKGEGFTLIELLIGILIFSLIWGAMTGVLISGIKLQRESLRRQQAMDQLSFTIEYMSRSLRMAVREDGTFGCLSTDFNYENPGGASSAIRFINHLQDDDCQEFFLENHRIKYKQKGEILDLTSPDLQIETLSFLLEGESKGDLFQPRVTISLKASSPLEIELQTTVSQRNLDI